MLLLINAEDTKYLLKTSDPQSDCRTYNMSYNTTIHIISCIIIMYRDTYKYYFDMIRCTCNSHFHLRFLWSICITLHYYIFIFIFLFLHYKNKTSSWTWVLKSVTYFYVMNFYWNSIHFLKPVVLKVPTIIINFIIHVISVQY